jgi:hypothetical protein
MNLNRADFMRSSLLHHSFEDGLKIFVEMARDRTYRVRTDFQPDVPIYNIQTLISYLTENTEFP